MKIQIELSNVSPNLLDQYHQYLKAGKHLKPKIKLSGQLSTLCKLLKLAIGVGILAIPEGFKQVYLLGGILTLAFAGLVQFYSWTELIDVIEEKSRVEAEKLSPPERSATVASFPDEFFPAEEQVNQEVVDDHLSQPEIEPEETIEHIQVEYGRINIVALVKTVLPKNRAALFGINITTFILIFGQEVGYIAFFYQTLSAIYVDFVARFEYKLAFIVLNLLILLIFSYQQRMENIRYLTQTGSYLTFIVMYFFMCVALFQIKLHSLDSIEESVNFGINFLKIPYFFGIALFAYDVNGVLTEIREEMESPQNFKRNLMFQTIICFVVYSIFGVINYVAYGSNVSTIITINLATTIGIVGSVVKLTFLALQLVYSFSVMINVVLKNIVVFRLIEDLNQDSLFCRTYLKLTKSKKLILRLLYLSCCVLVATFVKSFSNMVSFLGATTSVILGFVIPYYLYTKVFPNATKKIKLINFAILSLGVIGGAIGIVGFFLEL